MQGAKFGRWRIGYIKRHAGVTGRCNVNIMQNNIKTKGKHGLLDIISKVFIQNDVYKDMYITILSNTGNHPWVRQPITLRKVPGTDCNGWTVKTFALWSVYRGL